VVEIDGLVKSNSAVPLYTHDPPQSPKYRENVVAPTKLSDFIPFQKNVQPRLQLSRAGLGVHRLVEFLDPIRLQGSSPLASAIQA
jgi:hypothetical protein